MPSKEEKSKSLIVKSNDLIESNLKGFSLVQTKLLNLAISKLTPDTPIGHWFDFEASYLLEKLNMGEGNHKELRKATLDMLRGVEVKQGDRIMQRPLIVTDYIMGEGIVRFRFDHDVQPFLVDLKERFTKYYFENIQRLSSTYAIRLYELLKQYQKIGKRDLTLDDLRFYLDVPEGAYSKYNNFKQRVIEIAQREINDKTDLSISFEPIKPSRKITGITFYINSQKRPVQPEEIQPDMIGGFDECEEEAIKYIIKYCSMSKEKAAEYVSKIGVKAVNDLIDEISHKDHSGEIASFGAYMEGALNKKLKAAIDLGEQLP